MGSYGYGPFDGDSAAEAVMDPIEEIGTELDNLLKAKKNKQYRYDGARAAAVALALLSIARAPVPIERLLDGEKCIKQILGDEDWINNWNSPARAKRAVKQDLKLVQSAINRILRMLHWTREMVEASRKR